MNLKEMHTAFNLRQELAKITEALRTASVEYALCEGLAVAIHGYPRATRDIDLLIREEDLEKAKSALEEIGYILSAGIITFDTGKETERRIFRISKAEGEDLLTLDLMLVTPLLEDVWRNRKTLTIEGRNVQVVSLEGLEKMKRLAGRPQDLADLDRLAETQEEDE